MSDSLQIVLAGIRENERRLHADRAALLARVGHLEAVLRALEWSGTDSYAGEIWTACPCCGGLPSEPEKTHPAIRMRLRVGHAPDCALAAALATRPEGERGNE